VVVVVFSGVDEDLLFDSCAGLVFPEIAVARGVGSSKSSPESGVFAAEALGLDPSLPNEYSPERRSPTVDHGLGFGATGGGRRLTAATAAATLDFPPQSNFSLASLT
jgi:hypothetical protein